MKLSVGLILAAMWVPNAGLAFETMCPDDGGCGVQGNAPGTYHIAVPDGWTAPGSGSSQKTLIFYHGHGGSGAGLLRNKGLIDQFTGNGYVVIAPDATEIPGRTVRGWPARPDVVGARDDIAFSEAMIADAKQRLGIATLDILMGGFSAGGSMAWQFACYSGEPITAVVSIAGGLRDPIPTETCPAGPRKLLQIHGFTDNQVPLEGRGIGDWHQGDVFAGLGVLRATNACRSNPDALEADGAYWCRDWTSCDSGQPIRMCLHAGGHSLPKGWVDQAIEWHNGRSD